MATIVASATGGAWNTNGAWVGGIQPSASSDVQLNATSGPIQTAAGAVCRSLDCTGYTNTLTMTSTLTIGDATAGLSNIAFKLVAGMTYTVGGGTVTFVSTSATVQTITTAGKTLGAITFAAAGKWQLVDSLTCTAVTSILTFTAGTLDTNSQAVSIGQFSSTGSVTRTLTLGSSAITCNAASTSAWTTSAATSLTITANTAVVTCNGAGSGFAGTTALNLNGMSIVLSGSGIATISNSFTMANLTRTGTAAKTDALTLNGTPIITGTFAVNGNSAVNRLIVQSQAAGSARVITAAIVSASYVDFADITGAGAANWNLAAISGLSGDAGGNSGITFTTPVTQTWQGTTSGNWQTAAKWTSRVPLPQDNVLISSAFSAAQVITLDMPRAGASVDFTGTTGNPAWTTALNSTIYGSITLVAGMTVPGPFTTAIAGRGTHTITSAGVTFGGTTAGLSIAAGVGSYTLTDAFVCPGTITQLLSSFNTAGFSVTCGAVSIVSGTLTLGTTTLTLTATTGTLVSIGAVVTFSGASASIVISTASSSTRIVTASAKTIGSLTYTVANSVGALQFFSSTNTMTLNTLNVGPGRQIIVFVGATLTVGNWNVAGRPNGYIRLPAVTGNYMSVPDSAALSFTGDLDFRARVALDVWIPSANNGIINKWTVSGQFSYRFIVLGTSGFLRLELTNNGTTLGSVNSILPGFTNGTTQWVRVTWRASDGRVQFFTASGALANPVAADFSQLGTDQTISIVTIPSVFDSTSPVELGSYVTGTNTLVGAYYRAQIRNGIDGTLVLDADMVNKTLGADTFVESSAQAATVTVNGAIAQAGDGRVALSSSTAASTATLSKLTGIAASNYLTVKDLIATGGASWYAGRYSVDQGNNTGWRWRDPIGNGMLEVF